MENGTDTKLHMVLLSLRTRLLKHQCMRIYLLPTSYVCICLINFLIKDCKYISLNREYDAVIKASVIDQILSRFHGKVVGNGALYSAFRVSGLNALSSTKIPCLKGELDELRPR